MSAQEYDVVVVGAGVAGAVLAKHLTDGGLRVLILEAGPASAQSLSGYTQHLQTFYEARSKGPESAWPADPNAPQPDTADLRYNNGYFVQNGPQLYGSSYSRVQGGSTLHWLGVSLRMLPEDFELRSLYGVGRDWPLRYDDLEPFYRKAERDLGVSANVSDQQYHGLTFPDGYDYPMERVPLSYSDQWLSDATDGLEVSIGERAIPVHIRSYPAARNSIPRPSYQPTGALDRSDEGRTRQPFLGERCQGNTSCTPICPVQAKYNAGRTLAQIEPRKMELRARAVASEIDVDSVTGAVRGIRYKQYDGSTHTVQEAKARRYVIAAHAVENAKLMLASGLEGTNKLVGCNLMDHPTLYAWGLAPKPIGPFRGPLSTAGIEDFRSGSFRAGHAAFRFDVGNDGWKAPTGSPDSTVLDEVMHHGRFGRSLRQQLESTLSRQVRLSLAVEQLPEESNRVRLDQRFLDPLGNPRPAIDYRIHEYSLAGMAEAARVARAIFDHAGIEDHTDPEKASWFPSVQYRDRTFHYHGMGHFAGTHLMGDDAATSVVDHQQRSWEHKNLYLIGSGSFPSMGTSNPTLTIAALAIRTAEHLVSELTSE